MKTNEIKTNLRNNISNEFKHRNDGGKDRARIAQKYIKIMIRNLKAA